MVEYNKWYTAQNGWAFIFLFNYHDEKYGIAFNSYTTSGYVYIKENNKIKYRPLYKEEANSLSNNILKDIYNNLSPIKEIFIRKLFSESHFLNTMIRSVRD